MNVILLERVQNLGNLGDKVKVAAGYARNFLIPGGHALPATGKNLEAFEERRAELEKQADARLADAKSRAEKIDGLGVVITANMSDEGKLFGSIGTREIVDAVKAAGHDIEKKEVLLPEGPLHYAGDHEIQLMLHSDVFAGIKISIVPAEGEV